MVSEVGEYGELIQAARDIKISMASLDRILNYYEGANLLSKKGRKAIEESWKDEKLAQYPGTLYGLSMLASYYGTHTEGICDKPMGGNLRRMAGEALVVAQDWKAFDAIVKNFNEKVVTK